MIYTIFIILGIVLDRISKSYAISHFIENPVYTKLINFIYVENKGAAFGILQDKRLFFIILTLVVVSYLLYYFVSNIKSNPKLLNISLSLIVSVVLEVSPLPSVILVVTVAFSLPITPSLSTTWLPASRFSS